MPQNSYTDADLARFERKPLSVTIERPNTGKPGEEYPDYTKGRAKADNLLGQARRSLAGADHLSAQTAEDIHDQEIRNALGEVDQESVFNTPSQRLGRLASHTPDILEGLALPASIALSGGAAAIPEAYLAARSGDRLASGKSDSKWADIAQLVGGGAAALGGLNRVITNGWQAAQTAADAASRTGEAAALAGKQSEMRYLGRQMDAAGFNPEVTQKVSGLHPKAPRSISTQTPVSFNDVDVSGLMDEVNPGRYQKGPVQGLMQALENRSAYPNLAWKSPEEEALGARLASELDVRGGGNAPEGPTYPPNHVLQPPADFGVDPNFAGGVGNAELAGSAGYPRATSGPLQGLRQATQQPLTDMDIMRARAGERFGKKYYKE